MGTHSVIVNCEDSIDGVCHWASQWIEKLGLGWEVLPAANSSEARRKKESALADGRSATTVDVLSLSDKHDPALEPDEVDWIQRRSQSLAERLRGGLVDCVLLTHHIPPHHGSVKALESYLVEVCAETGVHLILPTFILSAIGKTWNGDYMGSAGPATMTSAEDLAVAVGTALIRYCYNVFIGSRKVIVSDCDETLWRGYCGETGEASIILDETSHALQTRLRYLSDNGFLLCLCSKNDPEAVLAVFREHAEMPLQLSNIVAYEVNWSDKAQNLRRLSDRLNISLCEFIFIDDDEIECARIERLCPTVVVIRLNHDLESLTMIDRLWALDSFATTQEDRKRTSFYRHILDDTDRRIPSSGKPGISERLTLSLTEMTTLDLDRAASLSLRTNQFNSTTRRRAKRLYGSLLSDPGYRCHCIAARDAFGDYGIVGTIIVKLGVTWVVDEFTLSCRVLGRGLEWLIIEEMLVLATNAGQRGLTFEFEHTERNARVAELFAWASGNATTSTSYYVTSVSLRLAQSGAFTVDAVPSLGPGQSRDIDHRSVSASKLIQVARSTRSVEGVLSFLSSPSDDLSSSGYYGLHEIGVARFLLDLWSELLSQKVESAQADFFDLGGDSLIAMQTIARVKRVYGVLLDVDDFFVTQSNAATIAAAVISKVSSA